MAKCLCGCGRPSSMRRSKNGQLMRFHNDRCRVRYKKQNPGGLAEIRHCRKCGVAFEGHGNAANCELHRDKRKRQRRDRYGPVEPSTARPFLGMPCASCALGKASPDAVSGYICTKDKAFDCKPWHNATLYRERLIGGQTAC